MHRATWFDLASLTKVIFTTPAILRLVDEGRIALDDPLDRRDPGSAPVRSRRRARAPADLPPVPRARRRTCPRSSRSTPMASDPATLRAFVLQRDWRGRAAGLFRHQLHPARHRDRAADRPRALASMPLPPGFTFRPDPARTRGDRALHLARPRDARRGARRERLRARRRVGPCRPVRHGRRRARLRARPARRHGARARWLAAIRTRQSATRSLGWEARHDGWSGGDACSDDDDRPYRLHRHRLWIDFDRGLAWTLLTNRVHPTRHRDTGIVALRRRVGDLIVGAAAMKRRWCRRRGDRAAARCAGHRSCSIGGGPACAPIRTPWSGFDGAKLIWRDGTRMAVDDGRPDKSLQEQLRRRLHPGPVAPGLSQRARHRCQRRNRIPGACATGRSSTRCMATAGRARLRLRSCPSCWLPASWGHAVPHHVDQRRRSRAGGGLARTGCVAGGTGGTCIRWAVPMRAARSPTPARPACTPGAPRSTSTRRSPTIGCGTGPPAAFPLT